MSKLLILVSLTLTACFDSTSPQAREDAKIKASQDACLDSCPRGVLKFEYKGTYGGFDCQCRP